MSPPRSTAPAGAPSGRPFTRRTLLVATLAGTAVAVVGCTGTDGDAADAVTPAQVDQLAAQVRVQEELVDAYARALTAAPDLTGTVAPLADQARAQLERLRAAAPGDAGTPPPTSPAPVVDPAGARAWLRSQVAAAAGTHAAACPDFTGGRAALLGSIAAGLRGQDGLLA
jgi:hypothetical protein